MTTSTDLEEARRQSLEIWDALAAKWGEQADDIWEVSRHVGEWMVASVTPQPGENVLDIAAGPGDTGFVAARAVGETGRLTSTDFAPHMVDAARRRAESLGIENAEFKVMNAEQMDLPDGTYDVVLCRWGLMLMQEPQKALSESMRVMRPGGRLACATWSGPERNPWVTMTGMTLAQMGHPPGGDPFGPGGMFSMADPAQVTNMLEGAGFHRASVEELDVKWTFADFDEFWRFLNELAGAIAMVIRDLPEQEKAQLQSALAEQLEAFRVGDAYEIPGVSLCARAEKPA